MNSKSLPILIWHFTLIPLIRDLAMEIPDRQDINVKKLREQACR